MLKEKMLKALNDQINEELYSAYLYLSMSAYFEDINLPGCANWMRIQVQEELSHAMKFYDFINDRHSRINLGEIKGPQFEWKSPMDAFEAAFKHEQHISSCINSLADIANELGDHPTMSFLKWFIDEQVEEEASVDEIIQKLKLAGEQGPGMYMLDQELSARVFVPPASNE